jgi:histidine triad (HIT) family protein
MLLIVSKEVIGHKAREKPSLAFPMTYDYTSYTLLSMDTVFTKIINREMPADIFYEDEHTIAFLDNFPNTKGHSLVIPKKPVVNIFDTDEETLEHVMRTVRKVTPVICKAVGSEGVNIISNNAAVAGQIVFHMHVHIIPRFPDDGLTQWPGHPIDSEKSKFLVEKLQKLLG